MFAREATLDKSQSEEKVTKSSDHLPTLRQKAR
jgi:hypothetical protein